MKQRPIDTSNYNTYLNRFDLRTFRLPRIARLGIIATAGIASIGGAAVYSRNQNRNDSVPQVDDKKSNLDPASLISCDNPLCLSKNRLDILGVQLPPLPASTAIFDTNLFSVKLTFNALRLTKLTSPKVPPARVDEAISRLLRESPKTLEAAEISSKIISAFAKTFKIEARTVQKAFAILESTPPGFQGDILLIQVLKHLGATRELLMISKYHLDDGASSEAIKAISGGNNKISSWLSAERSAFLSENASEQKKSVNEEIIRATIEETFVVVGDLKKELLEMEDALSKEQLRRTEADKFAQQRSQKIQELSKRQDILIRALSLVEDQNSELTKLNEARYQAQLAEWNRNHVTVTGHTYFKVRMAATSVLIGTQKDFTLDVDPGERVLFAIHGYGESEHRLEEYTLKQDRKHNSEIDHANLQHGHVWVATSDYRCWNERAYVDRKNKSPQKLPHFYIVSDAHPKPLKVEVSESKAKDLKTSVKLAKSEYTLLKDAEVKANE